MNGYTFWGLAFIVAAAAIACFTWLWRASEPPDPTDVWCDDTEDAIAEALNLTQEPLYDRIARNEAPGLVEEIECWLAGGAR